MIHTFFEIALMVKIDSRSNFASSWNYNWFIKLYLFQSSGLIIGETIIRFGILKYKAYFGMNRASLFFFKILYCIFHISYIFIRQCFRSNWEVKTLFLNWDSLHVRLNSHNKEWSYKKKKHKKIKAYMKSLHTGNTWITSYMNLFIHEISLQESVLVGVNCLEDILIIHLVLSAMLAVLCVILILTASSSNFCMSLFS